MKKALSLEFFIRQKLLPVLIIGFLTACQDQPVEEQIQGKWQMNKVVQQDNDVSAEHNPNNDRWIEFFGDKTFKTGGTPFGDNHGTWYLKNDGQILYLDSSAENDDSEWNLTIGDDEMQWTGIGDPGKEAFTLIHRRE